MAESCSANEKILDDLFIDEVKRLVSATKAGDSDVAPSFKGLSEKESETLRFIHKATQDFRVTFDFELAKYKLTNEALGIALWDMEIVAGDPVDPDNKITWSQEFRSIFGYENEQDFPNILSSWIDILHPEDKEHSIAAVAAHINDHTGKTPFNVEYRAKRKDGVYINIHAFGTAQRDRKGVPLRIAGAIKDITELKALEETVKAEKERTMLMLDTSPICTQIWDRDLNTFDCNEAGVRLYGFKSKR